ncbi:hypothetical protein EJB05_12452, partial [Eragrostis curvula]
MASHAVDAAASGESPTLLLIRRSDAALAAALRQRYRVLDSFASGEPLPAFLAAAAAAAAPDPPRAAVIVSSSVVRVDAALLDAFPSLRCVVNTGAGVEHVDLGECARRGVAVANSGAVYSVDVADHAVGLLVAVLRRVSEAERFVRRGLWPVQGDYPLGSKLGGKRVGIIGMGRIGSLIATRLQAFGCVIYYNSRRPKDSVSYKYFPHVLDLATESDVLIVACALNKETRHIVNKDILDALGKDGIIINIGRGAHIDEAELVRALNDGRTAGAGLDVFENEPEVSAELLSMNNVVLTHHMAVFTLESKSDMCDHTIANLEAFFSGKPLLTPVLPK